MEILLDKVGLNKYIMFFATIFSVTKAVPLLVVFSGDREWLGLQA
jgi:hypothetical protein